MKNKPFSELENMLLNIIEEGQKEVWQSIEENKNALERCRLRKLYAQCLKRLEK